MKNNTTINKEIFKKIEEQKESIKEALKKEFFGIDNIIDSIMDSMSSWLHFPELQSRPLVINLWGMTGCGKTSLINRIIDLLQLNKWRAYFNFAQLGEKSSYEIESYLIDNLSGMGVDNPIFIYDEFQYARTIKEGGVEDNKSNMKIFWELLDSGIYDSDIQTYLKFRIGRMEMMFGRILEQEDIIVKNGRVEHGYSLWEKIAKDNRHEDYYSNDELEDGPILETSSNYNVKEANIDKNTATQQHPFVLTNSRVDTLFKILTIKNPKLYPHIDKVYEDLSKLDKEGVYEYIMGVKKICMENVKVDFSKSLIFVAGNLDEAFGVAADINPDMSADQYHKITKEISIVTIKAALQERFRNEQIARLGNIHLIYPAFTSQTYRDIISSDLDRYKKELYELKQISVDFDSSIKDIIYKDSVFPTHGTRPVFSTIYDIVKTKIGRVITYAIKNDITYDKILYKYAKGYFVADFINNKGAVVDSLKLKQILRVEGLRQKKNKNHQTLTAVHETGHFISMVTLTGELPEKIVSVTADDSIGGFVLPKLNKDHILNKKNLINRVAIYVGGRAAEEVVFGKEYISGGASHDLKQATDLLLGCARRKGFIDDFMAFNGWTPEQGGNTVEGKVYDKDKAGEFTNRVINEAYQLAKEIIEKQKTLFLNVSEYLTKKNGITDKQLMKFVEQYYVGEYNPNMLKEKITTVGDYERLFQEVLAKNGRKKS